MDLEKYSFRILFTAAALLLIGGTIFFHAVERLSWLDAYYFCVVTLSTVGYGDIVPKTPLGKFGATVYILLGVGIIAAFLQATARRRESRRADRFQKQQNSSKNNKQ